VDYKPNDQAIFKYKLEVTDRQELLMPLGTKVLKVDTQYGDITIWALVLPRQLTLVPRKFIILGTGQPIRKFDYDMDRCKYFNTVQQQSGMFIWHVFELDSPEQS